MKNYTNIQIHAKASLKAMKQKGKTVVHMNEDAIIDYTEKITNNENPMYMGVKDNKGISRLILKKLNKEGFILHTIDDKSVGGRAIDTNLINPLTGKVMTGSSSASAINVLLGINDLGIGTDGGGSVLAPAICLNLYSYLAKGMNLKISQIKKSTDGISFEAGIGFISKDIEILQRAVTVFLEENNNIKEGVNYEIYGIGDKNHLDKFEKVNNISKFIDLNLYLKREELIKNLNEIKKEGKIFISYEKEIDINGNGDSLIGMFGACGANIQQNGNKGIIRILNMINANCLAIPDIELGSAYLIYTFDNKLVEKLFEIGIEIDKKIEKNNVFERYFKENYNLRENSIIFDLGD